MVNTYLVSSLGQIILDSATESKKKQAKSVLIENSDEVTAVESSEEDCEQCAVEKLHKTCTICGE